MIPLCTQSPWGWHAFPAEGMKPSELQLEIRFRMAGEAVEVTTCCHADRDALGVPLRADGR